jgi:hypothetical protein
MALSARRLAARLDDMRRENMTMNATDAGMRLKAPYTGFDGPPRFCTTLQNIARQKIRRA